MSANAYIDIVDVPLELLGSSSQGVDDVSGAPLINFDGCPLAGQVTAEGRQVEFPFLREPQLRNDLVAWLMHWGIHFTVVM